MARPRFRTTIRGAFAPVVASAVMSAAALPLALPLAFPLAFSLAVAFAPTTASAQAPPAGQAPAPLAPPAAQAGPRAAFDKNAHDFGVVGLGTDPIAEFQVRNTGTAPLEIAVSSPPRGLRVVHLDRTIAPKASGTVRFTVDTFQAEPMNDWRVGLTTNDPAQPSVELTLKALVRTFLTVEPYSARFTFVQYGKEGGTAHLIAASDPGGPPLVVTSVDSPFDYIKATFREAKGDERVKEASGRQWRVALTISEVAPVGPIGGYVIVHTNHPRQPRAFLPVTGFVRPLFAVTPPSVDLREVKVAAAPGAAAPAPLRTLLVKNFGEEALALKGVSSDLAWLDGTIVETEAGHVWRIELRVRQSAERRTGPFSGTLRLATSSARVPEITVPIQGTVAADPAP